MALRVSRGGLKFRDFSTHTLVLFFIIFFIMLSFIFCFVLLFCPLECVIFYKCGHLKNIKMYVLSIFFSSARLTLLASSQTLIGNLCY